MPHITGHGFKAEKGFEAYVNYSGGGFWSVLAADVMQHMGYSNLVSMAGGIKAWREEGYPLEKSSPAP